MNSIEVNIQSPSSVTLRTVGPDDEAFLLDVYASTRADELALVPWNEEQRQTFVRMQFTAQQEIIERLTRKPSTTSFCWRVDQLVVFTSRARSAKYES